jgi:hypothetical protein
MGGLIFTSCNDDDEEDTPPPPANTVRIITGVENWNSSEIVTLNGRVVVADGATLNIGPGTIIKGAAGQGTAASALIVARGGTINAVGTASNPIVFTSSADNIQLGEKFGTNLDRTDNQLWGGVIILGSAPISAEDGDTETNIEGIPAEEGYGLYGGDNPNDNSGVFSYVSIRHGGISIGEGNEINALTLGGVGNLTVVNNVEVYATLDDGIECFGGTVNINNALVYYQGDDGIDLDMNYSGTISNFAVIHGDGIGTDESLEIDGPENDTYTDGLFTLSNGICRIEGNDGSAADFKSGAQGFVNNVTFQTGDKEVKFRTRFNGNQTDGTCEHRGDAFANLALNNPRTLVFNDNNISGGTEVYDGNEDEENPTVCPDFLNAAQAEAAAEVDANGSGATIDLQAVFGSWTLAGNNNQL